MTSSPTSQYDDEGNLVYKYKDTTGSPSGLDSTDTDVTEYSWDNRDRLKEVVHRATFGGDIDWTAEYKYDALNHRISSSYDNNADGTPDREERYVWDGEGIVLDFVDGDGGNNTLNEGTTSAPLSLATRYLWGQAVDQLLAQEAVDDGSTGDVSYIVRDNLGSTRSLVNSDGDLAATYTYDTYGNVTASPSNATDTRFLYTCQEYDLRLGFYYYNARWYDAAVGKFISEDPIGYSGGINLYEYVGDNPIDRSDPRGLQAGTGIWAPWAPRPLSPLGPINIISKYAPDGGFSDWYQNIKGEAHKVETIRDPDVRNSDGAVVPGPITSNGTEQIAKILEGYEGCTHVLNVSGHGCGSGIKLEPVPVQGGGNFNENAPPDLMKRIAKKLCPGAVVNLCSCTSAFDEAALQKMADLLQAKTCGCTGGVTGACHCNGEWKCKKPGGTVPQKDWPVEKQCGISPKK